MTDRSPSDVQRRDNVESVLPLSANQRALLLYRDQGSADDPGFLQVEIDLDGPLDRSRWQEAWSRTIADHPALRSSVRRRSGGDPVLITWKDVPLTIRYEDWHAVPEDEFGRRLDDLLEEDRAEGLDLTAPPTLRITTIALGPTTHHVVWTCHHLLVDGWSSAITLEDVLRHYRDPDGAVPPAAPHALRDHARWLDGATTDETIAYWRDRLADLPVHRRFPHIDGAPVGSDHHTSTHPIPDPVAARVTDTASRTGTTMNAVIQAAWALVLERLLGTGDVVFGTTVAGRANGIDTVERAVGYFSNGIPVRVTVPDDGDVSDWLRTLRDDQFRMQAHEHASVADIQLWSGAARGRALFETFLVVENFPAEAEAEAGALSMSGFRSGLTSAFPLTVAVAPGDQWHIQLEVEASRLGSGALDRIAAAFLEALGAVTDETASVEDVRSVVDDLSDLTEAPTRRAGTASTRAPTSETEHRLVAMWSELLGVDAVGLDEDWFDLGGTSLGAVVLFDRIAAEFGTTVPVHTLLRYPTVAGLARAIDGTTGDGAAGPDVLVPMQTAGDRTPLIGLHAGAGHVMFYRTLARELGPDQPFYGIEPVGLDGGEPPLDSIPAMATRYLEAVRTIQPHGPYRFIGYCFGGSVGLEMTRQLEADGERVEVLAVIDAVPGAGDMKAHGTMRTLKASVRRALRMGRQWWDGSFGSSEGLQRIARDRVSEASQRAFLDYRPGPVSVPVTVLRAEDSEVGSAPDMGWGTYAPEVSVHDIAAPHIELFDEPIVESVAAVIADALEMDETGS